MKTKAHIHIVIRRDLLKSLQIQILHEKGRIRKGDLSNAINKALEMYLKNQSQNGHIAEIHPLRADRTGVSPEA